MSNADAAKFRRRALSYGKSFREKDLSFADEVIISTSTFAHHVRSEDALVYWYTPPRFLYDPSAYFSNPAVAKSFELATTPLRHRDRKAAVAHRTHLANSRRTANRLRDAYGIEADVLYSPFDSSRFAGSVDAYSGPPSALVVSRLLPYKRVDLAIQACALAGIPLTIIGRGPDEERLRSIAPDLVTFVGTVTDDELDRRLRQAQHGPGPRDRGLRVHPPRGGIAGTARRGDSRGRAGRDRGGRDDGHPGGGADPQDVGRRHPPGERVGLECRCHAAHPSCPSRPTTSTTVCSTALRGGADEQPSRPRTLAWPRLRELRERASVLQVRTKSRNFLRRLDAEVGQHSLATADGGTHPAAVARVEVERRQLDVVALLVGSASIRSSSRLERLLRVPRVERVRQHQVEELQAELGQRLAWTSRPIGVAV